jgi:hypothetical protein
MFEIVTDHFVGMSRTSILDDKIPGCPYGDLVCHMTRENELAIIPSNLDLHMINIPSSIFRCVWH